jgi:endonuclease/exonuclease/phosphatase family metal-dependent hydrolase
MHLLKTLAPVAILAMLISQNSLSEVKYHHPDSLPAVVMSKTLDLLTLNVAHARGSALNQLLVSANGHRDNLQNIASIIQTLGVHAAALQEADGPSLWSGSFDHVEYLAQTTDFHSSVHGQHANSWLFSYGAALVSRYQLADTRSHRFRPSWPTAGKGFVVGSLQWQAPGTDTAPRTVTLASVHLDFSRASVRQDQIAEVIGGLEEIDTPLIVLGDFNADWSTSDSPVRQLANGLQLSVFKPNMNGLYTYKEAKRLDWIMISPELRFVEYDVLPDIVSDHLAIIAKIGWRQQNEHYDYD